MTMSHSLSRPSVCYALILLVLLFLGLDPTQYKAAVNHHGNEESSSFLMNEEERFKV